MRSLKNTKEGEPTMRRLEGKRKGIVKQIADNLKKEGINAEVCIRMEVEKEQVQS